MSEKINKSSLYYEQIPNIKAYNFISA